MSISNISSNTTAYQYAREAQKGAAIRAGFSEKPQDAANAASEKGSAPGAFQLSKNREAVMDKIGHTAMQSATAFSDMRAEILKGIREEKGYYDHADIMNACKRVYEKLYSEIEQRYEDKQEQYYKADGTLLTKEEEIEWLDTQYEQEMKWQDSVARIAAQRRVFQ